MIIMAIDGASRNGGTPNCLSAGSVFTKTDINGKETFALGLVHEKPSTSQRGELKALMASLGHGISLNTVYSETLYLITDSEYVFNTIHKDWLGNWRRKNWKTAMDEPVKNQDIWEKAGFMLDSYKVNNIELIPYHIKGHLISFGKKAAFNLLVQDPSGRELYKAVKAKLSTEPFKPGEFEHAWQLFERNHGHVPPRDIFMEMIACNTVADLAAGYHADLANM